MNKGIIVAGFALLSVAALTGWTRKASVAPAYFNTPSAFNTASGCEQMPSQTGPYLQPAPYGAPTPGVYAPTQPYAQTAFYRAPEPVYDRSVPVRRYVAPQAVVVRHRRPFSHSVAIVAGGAGAGAAIGALAGGRRGAGIGALAGGAAGFLYDRLTHNR